MIPAITWVPKGACKPVPTAAEPPSKEEIEEMIRTGVLAPPVGGGEEEGDMELEAAKDEAGDDGIAQALAAAAALGKAPKSNSKFKDITDALEELDMDNYDDEDDEGIDLFSKGLGDLYYPSNELDPFLKKQDDDEDDDSEEQEDMTIKASDGVIVCARNEDDYSHLEVWIHEESETGDSNMYVHHDVVLSEFPLCVAWLDCPFKGGEKGNFIAVGSMGPAIEIWDLDILDEVQPAVILGGTVEKKKKSGKTSTKFKKGSHTDSVLCLAWNKQFRNILASGSADKQVKIWDMAAEKCDITMEHHTNKVQALAWNHHEAQVLLSGSFDHYIVMKDGRLPSHPGFKWSVTADVESLAWDPHNNHSFVVSLEDGSIQGFDIRTASDSASNSRPSFTLHAHDQAVCTVSYNLSAPNLLATGSTDKMVKLWDLSNNKPSCVASMNPKAGAIFSVSFSEDSPFLLAIGGSKGKLKASFHNLLQLLLSLQLVSRFAASRLINIAHMQMWDTSSDSGVSRKFGSHSGPSKPRPPRP